MKSVLVPSVALLSLLPPSAARQDKPGKPAQEKQGQTTNGKPAAKKAEKQDAAKPKKGQDDAEKPAPKVKAPAAAQDFDKLLAPYLTEGLLGRVEVAAAIRQMTEDRLANQALPKLTGERNRLILQVRNLIESLGDVRYDVREESEKTLINMGPQILPIVESMKEQSDLEISIRLARVLAKLGEAGTEDIVRKALIARGLAESLEYRSGDTEARALLSGLDNLDSRVRLAAIRSLGTMLRNAQLAETHAQKLFDRIRGDVERPDLEMRNAATAALGSVAAKKAAEFLASIVKDGKRATSHRLLALRVLQSQHGTDQIRGLLDSLDGKRSASVLAAANYYVSRTASEGDPQKVLLKLKDGGRLETSIIEMQGDKILFAPSKEFAGLDALYIPRSTVDEISTIGKSKPKAEGVFLLLKSGTKLAVRNLAFDGKLVTGDSLGRKISLPRSSLRGLLPDPKRGRALGGSRKSDQVRLRKGKDKIIKGSVESLTDTGVTIVDEKKAKRELAWADVETVLFRLDTGKAASKGAGDINQYVQVDLRSGERLVGFLLDLNGRAIGLSTDSLGCFDLGLGQVASMQLSNSGRALTGFTLVTDYGNTRIVEYDGEGREVWQLEDLFDPLDAELTPGGTILVTEQGDNAVREYDREGNVTWEFTDVSRPLDADRLANGNTLITDPGNFRVIEVDPKGKIVWTFGRKEAKNPQFKPYDADRLPNGNTLIADYLGEQVLEITPAGKVAWRFKRTKYVCDADRLPNGNTLITMRQPAQVIEVTPAQTVVWKLTKLQLPWDADRLPDGTTMVSENFGVRIYSKEAKPLKKLDAEWASEANGY